MFIALREAIERRRSLVFLGERHAPAAHVEHLPTARAIDAHALVRAIAALPPDDRLALTLFYIEPLDDAEIGELIEDEPESVASRRRRTLRELTVRANGGAAVPVTPAPAHPRPPVRAAHAIWLMRRAAMLQGTSADATEEPPDMARGAMRSVVAAKVSRAVDDVTPLRLTPQEAKTLSRDARA